METLDDRLQTLESRLKRTQVALVSLLLIAALGFVGERSRASAAPRDRGGVLHARALVIEDEQGHPRLLLGAPAPSLPGRKRQEPVNGIVLVGSNGADRLVISYPGLEPQVQGKVERRSVAVPSAGLVINDADGDERAGFGVSDDGTRISLGLDYSDRDALGLVVSPGFSGLAMFARNGERNDQATMAVLKDGTSTFKLADSNGDEGLIVEVRKGTALNVLTRNPANNKLEDVAGRSAH